jgi:hypothetical protein
MGIRIVLTPEQITASPIGVLTNGTDSDLHDLWRELIGDPEYSVLDLSHVWPVALGSQPLNLDWYERKRRPPRVVRLFCIRKPQDIGSAFTHARRYIWRRR